jgi:pimeloyl-ACP methyl ester carboxylesterase
VPVLGRLVLWAWSRRPVFRWALASGQAVHDRSVLSGELVDGYIAANLADPHRRAKTRRYLGAQLDPANQRHTAEVAGELTRITLPTLIVWGGQDVHFGPEWGHRLQRDIPGARRMEILPDAGHLLMEEQPGRFAGVLSEFLTAHAAGGQ